MKNILCVLIIKLLVLFTNLHASENSKSILDNAKTNLLNQPEQLIPGLEASKRWNLRLKYIRQEINEINSTTEAINLAQTIIGFDHRISSSQTALEKYENILLEEFPFFSNLIYSLSDSNVSYPSSMKTINGRLVSNVFYYQLRYLLKCLTHINDPKLICEIGGGYGALCRLWMINTFTNPDVYVLIDYPESLFFAEVFLKLNLPSTQIIYLHNSKDLPQNSLELKNTIILCPLNQCNLLTTYPIDLVVNTGSLQEMSEGAVDFWMNWLDRSQAKYFYSLNYFAQPITDLKESDNVCAPRFSEKWNMIVKTPSPLLSQIQSENSRSFAEIIAERKEFEIDKDLMIQQLQSLLSNKLTVQLLLDALNIVQQTKNQEMLWELVKKILVDFNYIPKETLYFVRRLKEIGENEFLEKIEYDLLNSTEKKLNQLLEKNLYDGIEDMVTPIL